MVEGGLGLTEEMRQRAIGLKGTPVVFEVEKGHIRKFAEAIEDPNPLWNDEVVAGKSRYGGLIAPPTFLRATEVPVPEFPFDVPYQRLLDGGSEWEYFQPVRPGDVITAVAEVADLSEREGKLGTMLFVTLSITYANQSGQVVAVQRSTLIRY